MKDVIIYERLSDNKCLKEKFTVGNKTFKNSQSAGTDNLTNMEAQLYWHATCYDLTTIETWEQPVQLIHGKY